MEDATPATASHSPHLAAGRLPRQLRLVGEAERERGRVLASPNSAPGRSSQQVLAEPLSPGLTLLLCPWFTPSPAPPFSQPTSVWSRCAVSSHHRCCNTSLFVIILHRCGCGIAQSAGLLTRRPALHFTGSTLCSHARRSRAALCKRRSSHNRQQTPTSKPAVSRGIRPPCLLQTSFHTNRSSMQALPAALRAPAGSHHLPDRCFFSALTPSCVAPSFCPAGTMAEGKEHLSIVICGECSG